MPGMILIIIIIIISINRSIPGMILIIISSSSIYLSMPGMILRKSLWQPNCSLKAVKESSAATSQPRKARRARRKDQE